jgi:uncharacterized protein YacL
MNPTQNKQEEFFKREWKDYERIRKLNRNELLWEIWNERSNKLIFGLIGFIIGLSIGASGGSINDIPSVSIVLDVIAVIALIVLCSIKPKSNEF